VSAALRRPATIEDMSKCFASGRKVNRIASRARLSPNPSAKITCERSSSLVAHDERVEEAIPYADSAITARSPISPGIEILRLFGTLRSSEPLTTASGITFLISRHKSSRRTEIAFALLSQFSCASESARANAPASGTFCVPERLWGPEFSAHQAS